jgi:hypothetical protein
VVLHEVVHAYCHHSFGRIGPVWYSEGMAEMGHYWNDGDTTVRADPREIKYLRGSPANMLAETITPHQLTGDCWQNYASRWALCHFLVHSPNYSTQFSRFGRGLLTGRDISFGQTYGDVASELTFEYRFFLEHLGAGYCVQRTAWDWSKRFGALRTGRTVNTTISAGRGWQPTGLTVLSGAQYQYAASGLCSIDGGGRIVDADGDARGRGRLVGVLLDNYQLGSEFELGTLGAFEAPASGNLYLRCRNAWSELSTDSGRLAVRLQLQRQGFRE